MMPIDGATPDGINNGEVHLWLCKPSMITNATLIDQYHGLLNKDERKRYHRFHFEKDRHSHLVTRALIRTTLSNYEPEKAPQCWEFEHNAYGKPSLMTKTHSPIDFNITHSNDLIVIAITNGRKVGTDIEYIRQRNHIDGLAEHCFTPRELSYIYSQNNSQLLERFFQLWTLKESYIKAYGKGLSIALKDLTFSITDNTITLELTGNHKDNTSNWQFFSAPIEGSYQLALCVDQQLGELKNNLVYIDSTPMKSCRTLRPVL